MELVLETIQLILMLSSQLMNLERKQRLTKLHFSLSTFHVWSGQTRWEAAQDQSKYTFTCLSELHVQKNAMHCIVQYLYLGIITVKILVHFTACLVSYSSFYACLAHLQLSVYGKRKTNIWRMVVIFSICISVVLNISYHISYKNL